MKSRTADSVIFTSLFLCLSFMLWNSTLPQCASAASQPEILDQAHKDYVSGQSLIEVIGHALETARASEITPENLAASLAETLMRDGLAMKREGPDLAHDISVAFLKSCIATNLDIPTTLRTIAQMIKGIRTASAASGLDQNLIRTGIERGLLESAGTQELGDQLVRVVDSAFQEDVAETYTVPGGRGRTPEAPRETPPGVSASYDAVASPSRAESTQ